MLLVGSNNDISKGGFIDFSIEHVIQELAIVG